jgi:hypothetical protein
MFADDQNPYIDVEDVDEIIPDENVADEDMI